MYICVCMYMYGIFGIYGVHGLYVCADINVEIYFSYALIYVCIYIYIYTYCSNMSVHTYEYGAECAGFRTHV